MTRPQPNQRNQIELPRPVALPRRNPDQAPCPCGNARRICSQLALLQLSAGIMIGMLMGNLIIMLALSSRPIPTPQPSINRGAFS